MLVTGDFFSESDGPIFLSGLNCDGSEDGLLSCPTKYHRPPGLVQECTHAQDVAVLCQG